jgi:hypothetical protein
MPQIITSSMPLGTPGDITRDVHESTVEPYFNSTTVPVLGFGLPVKLGAQASSATGIVAADVGASIVGFSVREYPSYPGGNMANLAAGAGIPMAGAIGIMKRGYMAVKCNFGTPVKEGIVYVRIAAPAGAKVIGGIEATADGANTIIVPNAQFNGPADADGNAEIRYNV